MLLKDEHAVSYPNMVLIYNQRTTDYILKAKKEWGTWLFNISYPWNRKQFEHKNPIFTKSKITQVLSLSISSNDNIHYFKKVKAGKNRISEQTYTFWDQINQVSLIISNTQLTKTENSIYREILLRDLGLVKPVFMLNYKLKVTVK